MRQDRAGLRILLVDDRSVSAGALARLLSHEGHRVTTAGTVVGAIVAAATMPGVDVLVSEVSLPDGDGCHLMRVLSAHFRPRLAVALTGHGGGQCRAECEDAGYTHFLVKPIAFAQLVAAIDTLRPWRVDLPVPPADAPLSPPMIL